MPAPRHAMSLRIPDKTYNNLQSYCNYKNISMTEVVNQAIDIYLDSQKVVECFRIPDCDDLMISTTQSPSEPGWYDEMCLYNAHTGSKHASITHVPSHMFDTVYDTLLGMVDTIMGVMLG